MSLSVRINFPNSLLLVLDPVLGVVPNVLESGLVTATPTALAIGTTAEPDAPTLVVMCARSDLPHAATLTCAWRGVVETAGTLAVTSVEGSVYLATPARRQCSMEVWANDLDEPSEVWLALA